MAKNVGTLYLLRVEATLRFTFFPIPIANPVIIGNVCHSDSLT